MEFNEKLNRLRKSRGLTQEELAEILCVSRAAVAKWEQGRGYPTIDSLKDIASFFSVTIDELLSGEKLLSIAQTENKQSLKKLCDSVFGCVDLLAVFLVILPLYPQVAGGYVHSVNLLQYGHVRWIKTVYWQLYILLVSSGILKILLAKFSREKENRWITDISIAVNILAVLFLALTREAYAVSFAFFMLIIKWTIMLKYAQTSNK